MNSHFNKELCVLLLPILAACSSPQSGSEEYWFNKMQMEQRAQCAQLPEPLASNCLRDNDAKSYQDFVREKQKKQTTTQSTQ
jgi:Tfp pilus assembly protein PilP